MLKSAKKIRPITDSDYMSTPRYLKHRERMQKRKNGEDLLSDEDSEDRRKKSKPKKKKRKKSRVEENDGSYYRLSKFFDQGSDEE